MRGKRGHFVVFGKWYVFRVAETSSGSEPLEEKNLTELAAPHELLGIPAVQIC